MAGRDVLLFGATGAAGAGALSALRDAGVDVVCAVRDASNLQDSSAISVDFQSDQDIERLFSEQRPRAVVSAMASRTGAPQDAWAVDYELHARLLKAAVAGGVQHWVQVSAICVQRPLLAFQHAKLAFEAELRASGLTWSIVRPTAFFKSLAGQFERVKAGKPYLVFADGALTACKPISDADLGRFILSALQDRAKHNAVLPIGGPGPAMTPMAQGEALFAALGRTPKFRHVPVGVLDAIAGGLRVAGWVNRSAAAKAELARIGRYYATESMLVLNAEGCYDADATPETGSDTLSGYFQDLAAGRAVLNRGAHAVF